MCDGAGGTSQSSSRGPGWWGGSGVFERRVRGGGGEGRAEKRRSPRLPAPAHPGAAVSWSPAPAARQRWI